MITIENPDRNAMPRPKHLREMHKNWLVFEQPAKELSFEMRMVQKNIIPGLLPLSLHTLDATTSYAYDVTSRVDLLTFTDRHPFGGASLRNFFLSILQLMQNLEEYLLDGEGLLLWPAYVYLDAEEHPSFCYADFAEGHLQDGLRGLADCLLDRVDPADVDALVLICRIRFVLQREDWEDALIELLAEKDDTEGQENTEGQALCVAHKEPVPTASSDPGDGSSGFQQNNNYVVEIPKNRPQVTEGLSPDCPEIRPRRKLRDILALCFHRRRRKEEAEEELQATPDFDYPTFDFSEADWAEAEAFLPDFPEEAAEGNDGTRVLARLPETAENADAWLIPEGVYDREAVIHLPRKMLLLGKQRPVVDIVLASPAVSRLHARIYQEGNTYFLADLNSKNGTYINGKALSGLEGWPLAEGDELRFADISYRFTRIRNGR